jgi:hypothetical protein
MDTIKILIPTDFSVVSLNLVKEAVEQSHEQKLDIILVYGAYLSSSISELLFFSKPRLLKELQSQEFTAACSLLKNKYQSKVRNISTDLLLSNNSSYVNQYLEQEQIGEVHIPMHYKITVHGRKYFDPTPLLAKVSTMTYRLSWPGSTEIPFPVTNHLSDLFLPG